MKAPCGQVKTCAQLMDHDAPPSLAEQLAAAQDWWREAGVDCLFEDEPVHWLRSEADEAGLAAAQALPAARAAPSAPPQPSIGGDPSTWPQDLAAFAAWWLAEPSLDRGGARPRVPPRGPAGARLMVLVPEPEAEDGERLLSGLQGRLLSNFLLAAGVAEEETYIAAGLPRHTPLADMAALADAGLQAVTLHHIALAAPERLLMFGRGALPLIGHDPAQSPANFREINHLGRKVPLLVSRNLELLLQRPATRSGFWQRWLDWTGS